MDDVPSKFQQTTSQVELVTKALPLALAGLYVVGFLIVALHLAGYGASSIELFKIQYLAAGFWFVIIFLVFFGLTQPVRIAMSELIHHRQAWKGETGKAACLGALVADSFWLLFWFAAYYSLAQLSSFQKVKAFMYPMRFLVLVLVLFDVLLHILLWLRETHKFSKDAFRTLHFGYYWRMSTIPVALVLLTCTVNFAIDLYPKIPFALGGGQTRQVIFWLGPGTSTDSFLERDHSNPYTVPYELLSENVNSFVVISSKGGQRAIEFDRKSVAAMIVLGDRPKSAPANFVRPLSEKVGLAHD